MVVVGEEHESMNDQASLRLSPAEDAENDLVEHGAGSKQESALEGSTSDLVQAAGLNMADLAAHVLVDGIG
jgi:hypothetical protein